MNQFKNNKTSKQDILGIKSKANLKIWFRILDDTQPLELWEDCESTAMSNYIMRNAANQFKNQKMI